MNKKIKYLLGWIIISIVLFFCFFGSTDAEGFHSGWLISTRPGWLWFTSIVYVIIVTIGYFLSNKLNKSVKNK